MLANINSKGNNTKTNGPEIYLEVKMLICLVSNKLLGTRAKIKISKQTGIIKGLLFFTEVTFFNIFKINIMDIFK